MPGISFLFKKRFHPARLDNQKRIFIKEEKTSQRNELEKEKSLQVMKERELQAYEGLGQAPDRDPRNSSLKFMYSAPAAGKGKDEKGKKIDLLAKPQPASLDDNGDDEFVRQFRAKFTKKTNEQEQAQQLPPEDPELYQTDSNFAPSSSSSSSQQRPVADQRKLEIDVGRRTSSVPTFSDQGERHPLLKNAPIEGLYALNMAVRHKPFSEIVRNVRCLRCGQWGHKSGERECSMKDINPLDMERRNREDPMGADKLEASGYYDDSSDPESEFLKTLTRREKRLLLRRLEKLEGRDVSEHVKKSHKKKKRKRDRGSSSSSSSDSDDSK
jgi:CBF1 interacting corepressor